MVPPPDAYPPQVLESQPWLEAHRGGKSHSQRKEKALIVSPPAGDTLHLFPPGRQFRKYNLPPHQDYQYLMQLPAQITM